MKSEITDYINLKTTGHLNLFKLKYKNKKGDLKDWLLASRQEKPKAFSKDFSADAVVIIAIHKELDESVLLKQYRPSIDGALIEFPAGKIDEGESVESAAKRELLEETGLKVIEILEVSPPTYSSSGLTDESVCFVTCYCEGELSTSQNEDSEEIVPFLISPYDFKDLFDGKFFNEDYQFCARVYAAFNC